MQYIVRSGSASYGARIIASDAGEALRAARSLVDRGASMVEVLDRDGSPLTFTAFSRSTLGHSLSDEQLDLVVATSDVVSAAGTSFAEAFYCRLFELTPDVRPMFSANLESQRRKLTDTLKSILEQITHPGQFVPTVIGLGKRHAGYGARVEHYAVVGEALLTTLAASLGSRFTPDVREAWGALYADLSAAMLAAGERSEADPDMPPFER